MSDDIPRDTLQSRMEGLIEAMRGARPGDGDMDTLPAATSAGAPGDRQVRRDTSHPQPGSVVSDTWELTEKLGHGGFGVVFAARHLRLDRSDAIKFLHPHLADDARLCERFRREALVMATLRGDHLVARPRPRCDGRPPPSRAPPSLRKADPRCSIQAHPTMGRTPAPSARCRVAMPSTPRVTALASSAAARQGSGGSSSGDHPQELPFSFTFIVQSCAALPIPRNDGLDVDAPAAPAQHPFVHSTLP